MFLRVSKEVVSPDLAVRLDSMVSRLDKNLGLSKPSLVDEVIKLSKPSLVKVIGGNSSPNARQ